MGGGKERGEGEEEKVKNGSRREREGIYLKIIYLAKRGEWEEGSKVGGREGRGRRKIGLRMEVGENLKVFI